jgi:uncharacterized membrane protein
MKLIHAVTSKFVLSASMALTSKQVKLRTVIFIVRYVSSLAVSCLDVRNYNIAQLSAEKY